MTKDVVEQVRAVFCDQAMREDWARTNYALGVKYFSYAVARRKLAARQPTSLAKASSHPASRCQSRLSGSPPPSLLVAPFNPR